MATPYTLRLIQANGSMRDIPVSGQAAGQPMRIPIGPNAQIELLNAQTGRAPARIRGKKLGKDLQLSLEGQEEPIVLSDYYGQGGHLIGRDAQGQTFDYLPTKGSSASISPPPAPPLPSVKALEQPASPAIWQDAIGTQGHGPLSFEKSLVPTPIDLVGSLTSPGGLTALALAGVGGMVAYNKNKSSDTPTTSPPSTPGPTPGTSPSPGTTPSPEPSPSPTPTSPPSSPSVNKPRIALSIDSGDSDQDQITNKALVTVTSDRGSSITYSINGGGFSNYVTPTVDGIYTVIARATSGSNNADSTPLVFTLDQATKTPTLSLVSDTGISSSDRITAHGAFTITPVDADATVSYTVNGYASAADFVASTDGVYTVVATAKDVAGNTASDLFIFTRDAGAVVHPLSKPTLALATDSGISSSDRLTNQAQLLTTGVDAGTTISYSVNGGAFGNYIAPTVDRVYTVVARAVLNGATQTSAPLVFTLDTTQAAPILSLFNDSGISNSDNITRFSGLSAVPTEAGSTISYTVNGQNSTQNFIASVDGVYTVVARAVDEAGNEGIGQLIFTRDTTIVTPTLSLVSDTGVSASDALTNNGAIRVVGLSTETGSTVKYSVNGVTLSTFNGATTDGVYTVVLSQSDLAGNSATSTPLIFTRDTSTTKPTVALTVDSGSNTTDNITNDVRIKISNAEANASFEYSLNNGAFVQYVAAAYEEAVRESGEGVKTVIIRSTDRAGNTALSDPLVYTFSSVFATSDGSPSHTPLEMQVDENTPAVQALYNLSTGLGLDIEPVTGSTSYRITGEDAGQFELNGENQLRFKHSPDYEKPLDQDADNTYQVHIERWDYGSVVDSRNINIHVLNKAEAGDSSVDLGSYGKLIAPVKVGDHWYYFWDADGNGQVHARGDAMTHDRLDALFNQNLAGATHTDADTDLDFRYATLHGVHVALPTIGDSADLLSAQTQTPRTTTHLSATADGVDSSYNDYAAIWDANNGHASGTGDAGLPDGWWNQAEDTIDSVSFWSASPAPSSDSSDSNAMHGTRHHVLFTPAQGLVWSANSPVQPEGLSALDAQELAKHYVVLEVLGP